MQLHDTDSYVIIDVDPGSYPPDLRWLATIGAKVRITHGVKAGEIGTILGHGRSRRADRQFKGNVERALAAGREVSEDDHGPLIDNEGPVVLFASSRLDWFPGQASAALEYVKPGELSGTLGFSHMVPIYQQDSAAEGKLSDRDKLAIPLEIWQWLILKELLNDDPRTDASRATEENKVYYDTFALIDDELERHGWLS